MSRRRQGRRTSSRIRKQRSTSNSSSTSSSTRRSSSRRRRRSHSPDDDTSTHQTNSINNTSTDTISPTYDHIRNRFLKWWIDRHRRRKRLLISTNSYQIESTHETTRETNDAVISQLRKSEEVKWSPYLLSKSFVLFRFLLVFSYFATASICFIALYDEINGDDDVFLNNYLVPILSWIPCFGGGLGLGENIGWCNDGMLVSGLVKKAKLMQTILESPFYVLFIQSIAILITGWVVSTVWKTINNFYFFLFGKQMIHETTDELKEQLRFERLNVTLNILEEGTAPWGDPYPRRTDRNGEIVIGAGHKVHMRTINEGPLMGNLGCFGGEEDPWVLKKMLKDNKPWNSKNKVAPFLSTSVLKNLGDRHINSFAKQMTDQIINRLSMLFGGAYVAQDQGLAFSASEYIFGLTYEEPDPEKNTNQKVRCLVMKKSSLKRLVELWKEDPLKFDFNDNLYAEQRTKHLINMYRIYQDRQVLTQWVNVAVNPGGEKVEVMGALVASLFIAAQGPGQIQVLPMGDVASMSRQPSRIL